MSTWIKICGITRPQDASLAVQLGADALGFVMHSRSPRSCTLDVVRSLIRNVSPSITCVGVWLDEPLDQIVQEANDIGCAVIQNYDLPTAMELSRRGLQCLPALIPQETLRTSKDVVPLLALLAVHGITRFIVDTTDRKFSRDMATLPQNLLRDFFALAILQGMQPILAGGLNAQNVRHRLSIYHPSGVDVASGVEVTPGEKDQDKLTHFFEEVRQWDSADSSAPTAANLCPKQ